MPGGRDALGIGYGLASGVCYAFIIFLTKRMKGIGGIETTLVQLFFAGLLVAALLGTTGQRRGAELDLRSLAIIGLFGAAVILGATFVASLEKPERRREPRPDRP